MALYGMTKTNHDEDERAEREFPLKHSAPMAALIAEVPEPAEPPVAPEPETPVAAPVEVPIAPAATKPLIRRKPQRIRRGSRSKQRV